MTASRHSASKRNSSVHGTLESSDADDEDEEDVGILKTDSSKKLTTKGSKSTSKRNSREPSVRQPGSSTYRRNAEKKKREEYLEWLLNEERNILVKIEKAVG